MTDAIYEDDEKMRSIIDVLKAAELFGEIISVKSLVSEDEVETEDDWVDVQSKYGHDTEDYVFGDQSEMRAGTISTETEPVSGHDWVSSVQLHAHALMVTLDGMSECGKPLTECSNFNCKHDTWIKSAEWLPQERYEFKQDWNSMADRPTENFMMGLPGLRYIEQDQEYFTRINTVCSHCYLYTPTRLATCQNCDKTLVAYAPATRGAQALRQQ
jgi:hypothetical protein